MDKKQQHTMYNSFKTTYSILNMGERKRMMSLIGFMLFCMLFEFISIGSLFPYIKIVSDPGVIHKNIKMEKLYQWLHFSSDYSFIIFLGCAIMGIMLFKAGLSLLNNYLQVKFAANIKNRIAISLFKSYLSMPLSKIIEEKSTFYSKYILYDVVNFFAVTNCLLKILTNGFMMLALVILMFLVSPSLLMIALVLIGGLVMSSVKATKRKSQKIGKKNELTFRHLYRNVDESLKGVKDIRIFQKESYFLDQFSKLQDEIKNQKVALTVMSNIPTVLINTMGFGIILGVVLVLLVVHGNILTLLPSLGVIAICIQRLLPGMTLITTSYSTVRTYNIVIFKIADLLKENAKFDSNTTNSQSKKSIEFENELEIKNVSFSYSSEKIVLSNMNLTIKKNSVIGIVGKSGSGKSTLVDLLLGLYPVNQGNILCDGVNINGRFLKEYKGKVAYISQKPFILDTSIKSNIAFGVKDSVIDIEKLDVAIQVSQLSELVSQLDNGLNEELGEDAAKISGGQKQRIGIARAIYNNADILIFDESTSALDVETERNFYKALKKWANNKKTIIIISHRKTLLDYCDHLIVMENGRVIEDNESIENESLLADV